MRPEVGPLGLVVLQSTGFRNIDCRYCYLPDRAIRKTMALSTVSHLAQLVFDNSLLKHELDIVWHAGEPLTLAPSYYSEAIKILVSES
jgi:uncharacterized protein